MTIDVERRGLIEAGCARDELIRPGTRGKRPDGLGQAAEPSLVAAVHARSDGIPYYAEELVARAADAAVAGAKPLEHNGYKVPLVHGLIEEVLGGIPAA